EALLPGLEDDAHAAAGDLLQQLVIPEAPRWSVRPGGRTVAGRQRRRLLTIKAWCIRLSHRPKLVVVRKECRQLGGQVGVTGKQLLTARRRTGLPRVQVSCDHLI